MENCEAAIMPTSVSAFATPDFSALSVTGNPSTEKSSRPTGMIRLNATIPAATRR